MHRSKTIPKTDAAARGRRSRDALLDAAVETFGNEGFDAVSIRRVADRAGVNTAMISYHFGGKEKLYEAAIGVIAEEIGHTVGPGVAEAERWLARPEPGALTLGRIAGILSPLIRFVCDPDKAAQVRLILREQQEPSPAFLNIYGVVMRRVLHALTRLVARARRRSDPDEDDRLTAITVLGQILVFRAAHAGVLMQMDWSRFDDARIDRIERRILDNVARQLAIPDESNNDESKDDESKDDESKDDESKDGESKDGESRDDTSNDDESKRDDRTRDD